MDRNRTLGMICGYFLSKYDRRAYAQLGFGSQDATHLALAAPLGVPPNSIKNWRDEFDPLHVNPRKGWHRRPMHPSRPRAHEVLAELDEQALLELVREIFRTPSGSGLDAVVGAVQRAEVVSEPLPYAPRGPTGRAAEEAYRRYHSTHAAPLAGTLEDRREDGCGYDFLIQTGDRSVAVEVKGLCGDQGGISFTNKEWRTAQVLGDDYYLALVHNALTEPSVSLVQNPARACAAKMNAVPTIQVNWVVASTELPAKGQGHAS